MTMDTLLKLLFYGGIIAVIAPMIVCLISDRLTEPPKDALTLGMEERKSRDKRIKRNQRRWKRDVRLIKLSEREARREIRRQQKKAGNDALDEVSHTLAVHQEILREMYGRHAPKRSKIVREVIRSKRNDLDWFE